MKGSLFLVVLASTVYLSKAAVLLDKDFSAKVISIREKCRKDYFIDDDEFTKLIKFDKVPESENGKCLVACVFEEFGYYHDGKFNVDALKASNKLKFSDEESIKKADNILDTCLKQVEAGENDCHATAKYFKCFLETGVKEGLAKATAE